MFPVGCFKFTLSISVPGATALGSATTGAWLFIDVYNYDPWPQDVELDLTTVHGWAGFAPTVTIPHLEKFIQQTMPPMAAHRISLPIQAHGGGHTGKEVFRCDSMRYRPTGTTGWGVWHAILAGNTTYVWVI
jgi:hypothetical protein